MGGTVEGYGRDKSDSSLKEPGIGGRLVCHLPLSFLSLLVPNGVQPLLTL